MGYLSDASLCLPHRITDLSGVADLYVVYQTAVAFREQRASLDLLLNTKLITQAANVWNQEAIH